MKKVKFGIIGCSRVAARSTIPAINSSGLAELSFIGSRSIAKARQYAKDFGCKSFGSYSDVLSSDVDAVYISLPIALQEKWAVMAANAGKHVLCEKSAAISLKPALKMANACRKSNVRIMEALVFKFHPQHLKIMEMVGKKVIGDVYTFYGKYGLPMPQADNIRLSSELGGGVLNDAGCYPVCASRMVFKSEPLEVISHMAFDDKHKVDIRMNAMLKYQKNRIAFVSAAYGVEYSSTYELWASKGIAAVKRAYSVPNDFAPTISVQQNNSASTINIKPADQFMLMIDSFCSEIKSNNKKINFEEDLISQAKVMEAIRVSARKGQPVKIK